MRYHALDASQIEWLIGQGVEPDILLAFLPMHFTTGLVAGGRFFPAADGARFIVFREDAEDVFWQPRTGELVTTWGKVFALGECLIDRPETYCLGHALNIFESPLDWLRARCDGVVVIDWSRSFDRLRDTPRIAVSEAVLPAFKAHMRPPRLPAVSVLVTRQPVL